MSNVQKLASTLPLPRRAAFRSAKARECRRRRHEDIQARGDTGAATGQEVTASDRNNEACNDHPAALLRNGCTPTTVRSSIPLPKQVEAIQAIMKQLREQKEKSIDFIVALDGFDPLAVRFQRFGNVATYSLLKRRPDETNAELYHNWNSLEWDRPSL